MSDISALLRKRGVVRASITRLNNRLTEVEEMLDREEAKRHAQRLSTRLNALDSEFKTQHFDIIAAIDESDAETLTAEQATMDKRDDDVDALIVRIETLLATLGTPTVLEERKILSRKLRHLRETLNTTNTAIEDLPSETDDLALIQSHEEELSSLKEQVFLCYNDLSSLEFEEEDELQRLYSEIKQIQFDCCHKIKKLLNPCDTAHNTAAPSSSTEAKGLKVLKLEAPTFDGNILNWTHFWEQFTISIDSNSSLTDAERFV